MYVDPWWEGPHLFFYTADPDYGDRYELYPSDE